MIILGIETSCDETSVSLVKDGGKILANTTASSLPQHILTGGIIPEVAARQQLGDIIPTLNESIRKAGIKLEKIDAIAATVGPGLIGSLLVGVETAKTLALLLEKPLIAANHLTAHLYANWLKKDAENIDLPEFSAISLIVSGGHTDLIKMDSHQKISRLGSTRDDAAGEAFDKTARILNLGYPGGPAISKLADEYRVKNPNDKLNLFPRPMLLEDNYDFSFSGLKTAVLRYTQNSPDYQNQKALLAANIQEAIVEVLVTKTIKAAEKFKPKSVIIAGGVAANKRLREVFNQTLKKNLPKIKFFAPFPSFSTDNAAPIAAWAYFNRNYVDISRVEPNPELTVDGLT